MSLPAIDAKYLADRDIKYEVTVESGMICVLFPAYRLPQGLVPAHSDLLLRLNPGYPDVPPDMWWFGNPVRRASGAAIPATDQTESYLGRQWQRWSRHLTPGQWRTGIDNLESFLALIRMELERTGAAAA